MQEHAVVVGVDTFTGYAGLSGLDGHKFKAAKELQGDVKISVWDKCSSEDFALTRL
jgi:hypothetical protein